MLLMVVFALPIACIDNDRRKGFDRSSSDHLQMLTMLWKYLKPTESHPDDDDFSLLGFQNGLRPETDLRLESFEVILKAI